jgi:hypothetical protein
LVALRCVGLVESVTVTATVLVPAVVGLPLMTPLAASMLNPAGNPVADHTYGVAPPLALTGALYAVPVTPPGRDAVVMAIGATIVSDRFLVAVKCVGFVESVTVTATVLVPAVVGLPVMAPLEASMLNPAGSPVADQVYGVVPPLALTGALYAIPATPPGNELVVIVGGAMMVSDRFAVAVKCDGLVESVTVIATVLTPAVVGVPLMAPVDAFKFNPAGSPVADHV